MCVNGEDLCGRRQKAGGQIIWYEESPSWSMEVVLLRRRDGDDVLDGLFGREDCLFPWSASFLGEGEGCSAARSGCRARAGSSDRFPLSAFRADKNLSIKRRELAKILFLEKKAHL